MSATRVIIDWSIIKDLDHFYDVVLPQCGSPEWHGRNLDALNDSWVTGSISSGGPPFQFEIKNMESTLPELAPMAAVVLEIAQYSVASNGGSCIRTGTT